MGPAGSISCSARKAEGFLVLHPILSQSTDSKYPIYIPPILRMINALLDQAQYRVTYAEKIPGMVENRPIYDLNIRARYLHLE